MNGVSIAFALQAALFAAGGSEYQTSYDKAEAAGQPLLVLVGKNDCPNCRVMKEQTLPALDRSGGLQDIVYTEVDSESNPQLTRQFLRGESLPQLVLYTPVGKLWRRTHIEGAQSEAEIRGFLQRQIARGKEVAAQSKKKKAAAAASFTPPDVSRWYSSGGS
jgi:thioredoxin-like negative regulator of GroEL